MSHKEYTVLFERVAEILETKKGTSMSKAIRQAVNEYELATTNPKARSVRPQDLNTDLLVKLAKR